MAIHDNCLRSGLNLKFEAKEPKLLEHYHRRDYRWEFFQKEIDFVKGYIASPSSISSRGFGQTHREIFILTQSFLDLLESKAKVKEILD